MLRAVNLDHIVTVVVTWGDAPRPKPRPDPLLLAAARLGIRPGQSWYVGNEPNDKLAAEAAGMNSAWAGWGNVEEPVPRVGCVIKRPSDLVSLLRCSP
jgi:phosphoglycolate phosphatase-like HAD superfamily hydrolase